MSEGIEGKARKEQGFEKQEVKIDQLPSPKSEPPPSWRSTRDHRSKDQQANSVEAKHKNFTPSRLFDVRSHVQNLLNSISKNKKADFDLEIDRILAACTNIGYHQLFRAHSQILAALLIALLEKDITQDTKSTRQRAFFTQVRKLTLSQNPSRTSIVSIALQTAASIVKQDTTEVLELFLVTCINLLPPVDVLAISSSVLQTHRSGKEGEKARRTFVETFRRCLEKISYQKEKGIHNFLSADLADHFLYVISTNESFRKDPLLKASILELSDKLRQNFHTEKHKMDAPSSLLSENPNVSSIVQILADIGPACTSNTNTLRDTLFEITKSGNDKDNLNETVLARLIHFFAAKATSTPRDDDNLSLALIGSLFNSSISSNNDDTSVENGWKLDVVAQVLSEDYPISRYDWFMVAERFDFQDFQVRSANHLIAILHLYKSVAKKDLPLSSFVGNWKNQFGQLSLLEQILFVPPNIYTFQVNEEEKADAEASEGRNSNIGWACSELLQRLFILSDVQQLVERVRKLFIKGLHDCPEILLCSTVRLQVNGASNEGAHLKEDLIRELIDLFFRQNPRYHVGKADKALLRLWDISPNTVAEASIDSWSTTINEPLLKRLETVHRIVDIIRLLPSDAKTMLSKSKDYDFSIAIGFLMADCEMIKLEPWLNERVTADGGTQFVVSLILFIRETLLFAQPRKKDGNLITLENIASSLEYLQSIDRTIGAQRMLSSRDKVPSNTTILDSIRGLTEICLTKYPALKRFVSSPTCQLPTGSGDTVEDIENMANSYFQKLYGGEISVDEMIDILKRFKNSGTARESEILACMVNNLFDEYRFFDRYQEKELRITGQFFGKLIDAQLVSDIALGVCLRYVMESLRLGPGPSDGSKSSKGNLFKFGIFALEEFKHRLHEWPQYSSHIIEIEHIKENYAKLFEEIAPENQRRGNLSNIIQASNHQIKLDATTDSTSQHSNLAVSLTQNIDPTKLETKHNNYANGRDPLSIDLSRLVLEPPAIAPPVSKPPLRKVAKFGEGLGRAVQGQVESEESQHESPPDSVLDRVQFLVNNVSHSNVEQKAEELKDLLSPAYFGWLGNYMVVKRISTQPNFHALYLAFFDQLGDYGKGLVEAILSSVYVNVGSLLRSPKITTSTSERSLLKNLGSWLGQITLARNRPILQLMLDCKELLFQGYETGMLIAVTPFVAKILEGAKNSIVFRPPNPWLMGLLSVFRALYAVDDLKMNIKFEVEVLCKNLGVKLEDIPVKTDDLAKRVSPVKDRNPDFNMKSNMLGHPQNGVSSANVPTAGGLNTGDGSGSSLPSLVSPNAKQSGAHSTANSRVDVQSLQSGDVVRLSNNSAHGPNEGGQVSASFQDQQQTVIPNLAAYVTINANLVQLFENPTWMSNLNLSGVVLKRAVPIAVDRAIREIIQPVVERSVTIACSTTKEIVVKDYAMESDENKMLKAAQLMVANLAGSLALVTCREPLRGSMTTHLKQLLSSNAGNSAANGGANTPSLSEQDKNAIEECASSCASDNLELGCMLIEKAATEKAVRDMDETLAPALSARKKHREQTGQPYYDMSIFGSDNHRYPAALPEPLRPKPGGLRNEQLLVYEAFQRMPRQPIVPGSQTGANMGSGNAIGSPVGSASGSVRSAGANISSSPNRMSGIGNDIGNPTPFKLSQSNDIQNGSRPQIVLDAISTIAGKLDNAVTSILSSVGARASDITLSMLPPDSEIKQLLLAIQQVAESATATGAEGRRRSLSSAETDSVLGFAQNVFKRLYDLSLSEPLRLEALVALLAGLNEFCPQLGQNLGTWATYAPTESESQRKLHRTVLLLLVRSRLIPIAELDVFLARSMDIGNNSMWIEFSLLFVRTAILENITSSSDTPKIMDILSMIGNGSSQVSPQIVHTYRKPILRLLEEIHNIEMQQKSQSVLSNTRSPSLGSVDLSAEKRSQLTHQQSSSIGIASLKNLADATRKAADQFEIISRNDPPGSRQQVTFLLDSWIRVNNEALGSEKALAQYLQLLQQNGIGKVEEQTERFFRLSTELVIESTLKSAIVSASDITSEPSLMKGKPLNYNVVDAYARLLALLIRYMNSGGSPEQVAAQRISLLNKVLGVTVRTLMANYQQNKHKDNGNRWDQRPWFRLLLNLVLDLNTPSPALDSISLGILSVFGSAFHVLQPLVVPGFAFAWLELMSHRMFLSNLLLLKGQKGWGIAHQLLIDLFLFLEPHLRKTELTLAIKNLYKGTLRVLLVLLHDFPTFLASYHLSFCNVIPDNCVQMRHLILTAFPRGMVLPDPFTPNLKIDLLTEISQNPPVLSNVIGPLSSIRGDLDGYLKSRQPENFVSELLPRLYKEGTEDIDSARINSLVLYVGMQAISRVNKSQIAHTPEMEVLQKLMDFNDRGRYISLNAIANQLRYPSSHTHYFSCVMLFLFIEAKDEGIKEQVTRVLLERLIVHRPHPWGLLITFIELIKNQRYQFWSHQFTRCATEIEKVFESVARSCMNPDSRAVVVGGEETL